MAALRNGIHTVLIPAENVKDLEEIDQTVRAALTFVPVKRVDEVLANALAGSVEAVASGNVLTTETVPSVSKNVTLRQ